MAELITKIELSTKVKKQLKKVPTHIRLKLIAWSEHIEEKGLLETRKLKGYHDEPLKGQKFGRRSIRLSKQWRAEYVIKKNGIELVYVEEVHPHDY